MPHRITKLFDSFSMIKIWATILTTFGINTLATVSANADKVANAAQDVHWLQLFAWAASGFAALAAGFVSIANYVRKRRGEKQETRRRGKI